MDATEPTEYVGPDGDDDNEGDIDPPPQDDASGARKESSDGDGIADIAASDAIAAPQNKDESESDLSLWSPISSSGARKPAPTKGKKEQVAARYQEVREMRPAPYFYYIDHSQDVDEDPLSSFAPALSTPNFVIKLHAILMRDSLSDVIGWLPHGRSWKIFDPPEFERQVLPIYFKQGSIASFHRQANGWGFRRMLKGSNKGSFYNEHFLRGLPFLCKKMKRTGVRRMTEDDDNNHEPVLWLIDAQHPTPQRLSPDSLEYSVLNTVNRIVEEGGASAKMPFIHNIGSKKTGEERRPGDVGVAVAGSSKPRSSSMASSGGSVAELPVRGDSVPHAQASLQRQEGQLLDSQPGEPNAMEQQVRMQQPQSQTQQAIGLILQANATEQQVQMQQPQSQTQQAIDLILQANATEQQAQMQQPQSQSQQAIDLILQANTTEQQVQLRQPQSMSQQAIALLLQGNATEQQAQIQQPQSQSQQAINLILQAHATEQQAQLQQPQSQSQQDTNLILQSNATEQQAQMHQPQSQSQQAISIILQANNIANMLSLPRQIESAPVPVASLQGILTQQHQAQIDNIANIFSRAGILRLPEAAAATPVAASLQENPAQQHPTQQQPHTAVPIQHHHAQQQPHAAIPQIDAIASILHSSGQLQSMTTPPAPADISAVLQGRLSSANIANLLGSASNSAGLLRGSPEMSSGNVLGRLEPRQANQVQGPYSSQQSEAMLRSLLLQNLTRNQPRPVLQSANNDARLTSQLIQNLTQNQSQPVLRSTSNAARFPQGTSETSGGNVLGRPDARPANQVQDPHSAQQSEAMLRNLLLQNLIENQPPPAPRPAGDSARLPRDSSEAHSGSSLGPLNFQQEHRIQGLHPAEGPGAALRNMLLQTMLRNSLLQNLAQDQYRQAPSSNSSRELHPRQAGPGQIQYGSPNRRTSSAESQLLNLMQQQQQQQQRPPQQHQQRAQEGAQEQRQQQQGAQERWRGQQSRPGEGNRDSDCSQM